jgi:hypothetical protein
MTSMSERDELLAWIAQERRTYPEAIEVWKTHCPRHSLWEDAVADGLVQVVRNGARSYVVLSPAGDAALRDATL